MASNDRNNNLNSVGTQHEDFNESSFMTGPSARNLKKQAHNTGNWQYITPFYRKGGPHARFEIKNEVTGEWVMADAFGYPTNNPNEASIRKVMRTPPPQLSSTPAASVTPLLTRSAATGHLITHHSLSPSPAPIRRALFSPSRSKRATRRAPNYRRAPSTYRRNRMASIRSQRRRSRPVTRSAPSYSATRSKNNK